MTPRTHFPRFCAWRDVGRAFDELESRVDAETAGRIYRAAEKESEGQPAALRDRLLEAVARVTRVPAAE